MAQFFYIILLLMLTSCMATELLEMACSKDAHCSQFERSKCRNLVCICMALDTDQEEICHPIEESQKMTNIIGGPCPCAHPHTECIERQQLQQCFCSKGYIPSVDRRRCLPDMVQLDGKCELDIQCQRSDSFSVCHPMKKRCLCKTNFEPHSGRCLGVLANENCKNDTDCENAGGFVCLPNINKCGCSISHVPDRNMTKCILGTSYGEICGHNFTCQLILGAAGLCREEDHRCACRSMHYPKRLIQGQFKEGHGNENETVICQPMATFGAYCLNDTDCQMNSLDQVQEQEPMQCLYGECHCGGNSALENGKCIAKSGAYVFQLSILCLIGLTLHWLFIGIYNIFNLTL